MIKISADSAFSGKLIQISFYSGLGLVMVSLLLGLLILIFHVRTILQEKHRQRFVEIWRPIFIQAILEQPPFIPRILKKDMYYFLALWNLYHEIIMTHPQDNLNLLARQVKADQFIKEGLRRNLGTGKHLVLLNALGHLRDPNDWEVILPFSSSPNPSLALTAMNALLMIDQKRGMPIFLESLAEKTNWPQHKISLILSRLDPEIIAESLIGIISQMKYSSQLGKFIRYLRFIRSDYALPIIRQTLARHEQDLEVISACLQVLEKMASPEVLPQVRELLSHPQWFIRIKAIQVLTNMGTAEEEKYLIERLSDKEWWARYRAAQAIANLPNMSDDELNKLNDKLRDPFARDILNHVQAEGRFKR